MSELQVQSELFESEFRDIVEDGVEVIVESDNHTPIRPTKSEAKYTVSKWLDDHKIFDEDEYRGALYGKIIELHQTDQPSHTVSRNRKSKLKDMAQSALAEEIVEVWISKTTKYRTDE